MMNAIQYAKVSQWEKYKKVGLPFSVP